MNSIIVKRLAIVALALASSACSIFDTTPDRLKPTELEKIETTAKLKKVWSASTGTSQDVRFVRLSIGFEGDNLFTTDIDGRVTAFKRATGDRVWRVDLDEEVSGGVGAGEGLVLLGTYSGQVIALDSNNGSELWRAQLSSEVLSAPQSNGSVVAVITADSTLFALDAKTGEQLWKYSSDMPKLTTRGTSAPVVTDSAIYAGFANGKLMAFQPSTGLELWERRLGVSKGRNDLEKMVDIDGTPLLDEGILYVASLHGRIAALGRADGRPLWAKEASSAEPLAKDKHLLFMSDDQDRVVCYQASSGLELWVNEQLMRRHINGPQVVGEYVAVVDFEGILHLMNQVDGNFAWRGKVDGDGVNAAMVSADGLLYVLGNSGKVIAYRVEPR